MCHIHYNLVVDCLGLVMLTACCCGPTKLQLLQYWDFPFLIIILNINLRLINYITQ